MFIPEPGSKHIRNATKDSPLDSSVSASASVCVESSTLGPSCLFTSVISQVDGGKQEAVSYFSRSAFWLCLHVCTVRPLRFYLRRDAIYSIVRFVG